MKQKYKVCQGCQYRLNIPEGVPGACLLANKYHVETIVNLVTNGRRLDIPRKDPDYVPPDCPRIQEQINAENSSHQAQP